MKLRHGLGWGTRQMTLNFQGKETNVSHLICEYVVVGPQLTIDFWKYSQDNLKCGKCWITRIFDEPKIYLRPRGSAPGFTRPLCLNCWEAVKGARLPVSGHKDEPLHGCYPTIFFSGKKLA